MHAAVLLLASCADPDPGRRGRDPVPTDGTAPETASTAETGAPADTDTDPPVEPPSSFDCSAPLTQAPFQVDPYEITTQEDFDFDALGGVVYATPTQEIVAEDINGNVQIVSPFVWDTRGMQTLSDGNLVVAYISHGLLGWIDRATGATEPWTSALVGPNAVEVGTGDVVYIGELGRYAVDSGRILRFDPATGALDVIAEGFDYPNGLALNEEQDLLYVADYYEGIFVLRKGADGVWGPREQVFTPGRGDNFDAVEVDVCGRVYVLNYFNGELSRYDPATGTSELLLELDAVQGAGFENWPSMRWGSGRGGWARDVLYATSRYRIFGVHVGVPGRTQPIDAPP